MSRLLIQSNGTLSEFQAGNYSLVGVTSLCIQFHVEKGASIPLEESALYEVFQLFERLKKGPILLKFISIYWTNGVMNYKSSEIWQSILRQIAELPTNPILYIDYSNFPEHFDPKNIRKLYFHCPYTIAAFPLQLDLINNFVKNSCLVDFGIALDDRRSKNVIIWAEELLQIRRPVDEHSFALALCNAQDLDAFVKQQDSVTSFLWYPDLAKEIRLNVKRIRTYYDVVHLLYCNWKFPRDNLLWARLPRDILHLILSLLHPKQWESQELIEEPWVEEVMNIYTQTKIAQLDLAKANNGYERKLERTDEIRQEMDDLGKRLRTLCEELDNISNLPMKSQIEEAKQKYESALKRLKGHVVTL